MAFDSSDPRILSKEEIFAAHDIEEEFVPVPMWGRLPNGDPRGVKIRTFSKKQADEIGKLATRRNRAGQDEIDQDQLIPLLFIAGVIEPHFELEDYERLLEKSAVAVALIQKAILRASGLSDAAVAEADKSNGAQLGTGIRVLPGARAEDDASRVIAADERA